MRAYATAIIMAEYVLHWGSLQSSFQLAAARPPSSSSTSSTAAKPSNSAAAPSDSASTSITSNGVILLSQLFSRIWTLLSLLTFNPFSKLAANDFSGDTPPWTLAFFGSSESYSFPSSPCQARLRVHENVKRFARNYTTIFVLFFACSPLDNLKYWLPAGTHQWSSFLTPEELVLILQRASISVQEMAGFVYNPLTGRWSLSDDIGVNFIAYGTKNSK